MQTMTYTRQYSAMGPSYEYHASDAMTGGVGYVARNERTGRWHASNRTWTGGGELRGTFATRREAAEALRWIKEGHSPDTWGGYADRYVCADCNAVILYEDGDRDMSGHLAANVRVYLLRGPGRDTTGDATCHRSDDSTHTPVTY